MSEPIESLRQVMAAVLELGALVSEIVGLIFGFTLPSWIGCIMGILMVTALPALFIWGIVSLARRIRLRNDS